MPVIGNGRPCDLYECGEAVPVTVELKGQKEETDQITLRIDDNEGKVTERSFSAAEPITFVVERPCPGFVNFQLQWHHKDSSVTKLERSVGFSVEEIKAEPEPEDFYSFWRSFLMKLQPCRSLLKCPLSIQSLLRKKMIFMNWQVPL